MSVLLICAYPCVSSDVRVAHLCLPLCIYWCQCCSSVFTLGYLLMSVLLIYVYPWVSSDVSGAHLCLPLGI